MLRTAHSIFPVEKLYSLTISQEFQSGIPFNWRRKWQPTAVFLPGESTWTEGPSGLQIMVSKRVGHDWVAKHSTARSFSDSFPTYVNREYWVESPVLHDSFLLICFTLVIYFIHSINSVLSVPISWFIPPLFLSPFVLTSVCIYFCCVNKVTYTIFFSDSTYMC